ncbi:hypothetical protein AB0N05_28650 [Nocardia sp. NPDC051030]|uniref:hypothetical protein n=1 Tax=Nocardia sp. NPDC051030 TaxID=3155162 RepID=UPI00342A1570
MSSENSGGTTAVDSRRPSAVRIRVGDGPGIQLPGFENPVVPPPLVALRNSDGTVAKVLVRAVIGSEAGVWA